MTAAVGGPSAPVSIDTRQRVLETALRMFGERGYAATSFRDIALELGLTKAAVYYHFPSKEGLVTALIEPLFDSFEAALDTPAPSRRDLLARLQQLVFESGTVMSVLSNDPSLAEAGVALHLRAKATARRCAEVLAGPHPSRAKLARSHAALGALFGGMHGLAMHTPEVPLTRRDLTAILDAAVTALGS